MTDDTLMEGASPPFHRPFPLFVKWRGFFKQSVESYYFDMVFRRKKTFLRRHEIAATGWYGVHQIVIYLPRLWELLQKHHDFDTEDLIEVLTESLGWLTVHEVSHNLGVKHRWKDWGLI